MRTTLHLARHADTVWHAENRYAGVTDVALSDDVPTQADDLATWAQRAGVSTVWSSPLSRALLTAAPAARTTGQPTRQHAGLLEVNFGAGEGLTADEMRHAFGPTRAVFERAPATNPLPGGESGHHAIARGRAALRDIINDTRRHDTQAGPSASPPVLVVAHSTLLRLLLCDLLGLNPNRYRTVLPRLNPTAVTTIAVTAALDDAQLLGLNVPTTRRP